MTYMSNVHLNIQNHALILTAGMLLCFLFPFSLLRLTEKMQSL